MGKYANGILVCRDDSGRDIIPSHQMNLSNDSVATDALLPNRKRGFRKQTLRQVSPLSTRQRKHHTKAPSSPSLILSLGSNDTTKVTGVMFY